ncbi:hypothetical protein [Pseudomonas aeruginosa]|uniref:hypothetical protein n=1 Tax=Pseudomonas aeruginosa TaxID=287 RepID=UPI001F3A2431|nr:hypothetical protein [Pseudomonas aeruginosa]
MEITLLRRGLQSTGGGGDPHMAQQIMLNDNDCQLEEITNLTFIREWYVCWQIAAANDGGEKFFGVSEGWPRQCCSHASQTKFF